MKVPFPANNQITNNKQPANNNNSATAPTPTPTPANYEPKSVLDLQGSPGPITDQKPLDPLKLAAAAAPDDHHVDLINSQLDDFDSLMRDWGLQLHDDDDDPTKPFSHLTDSDASPENTQITDININNNNNNNNFSDQFPNNNYICSFDSGDQHHQFATSDNSFNLLPEIPIYTAANPNFTNPIDQNFPGGGDPSWTTLGLDYVDDLIRLAQCIETNSIQLGQGILARLSQRLRSPAGKPLQRAAFYFKEAIQSFMLTGSGRPSGQNPANTFEIVQVIKAQKAFSSVSPIPMFAGFTANQAVLEALGAAGAGHVHVIDFDIGLGGHWASFMKELADRSGSRQAAPTPSLRVSAVVPEGYAAESGLIRENLALFARELNIRFDIEFVLVRTFEYLSFKAFKYMDGEKVAVILSPAIFRQVGAAGVLGGLRRISPHVVVHVDAEGMTGCGTTSFRQAVIDGLEFYSTLLESLEAANFNGGGGGGGDWMRRIETFVVYPKIAEAVEGAGGRQGTGLSEALAAAGLRQVGLSQFAEFQADCLLRRVQIRGFHVAKRQAEMLLCWHDRPLVATSSWRY